MTKFPQHLLELALKYEQAISVTDELLDYLQEEVSIYAHENGLIAEGKDVGELLYQLLDSLPVEASNPAPSFAPPAPLHPRPGQWFTSRNEYTGGLLLTFSVHLYSIGRKYLEATEEGRMCEAERLMQELQDAFAPDDHYLIDQLLSQLKNFNLDQLMRA